MSLTPAYYSSERKPTIGPTVHLTQTIIKQGEKQGKKISRNPIGYAEIPETGKKWLVGNAPGFLHAQWMWM